MMKKLFFSDEQNTMQFFEIQVLHTYLHREHVNSSMTARNFSFHPVQYDTYIKSRVTQKKVYMCIKNTDLQFLGTRFSTR